MANRSAVRAPERKPARAASEPAEPPAAAGPVVPVWLPWLIMVISVVGIGISAYLTVVHYAKLPLACPTNGIVNCALVTSSPYSVVGTTSIPITVPGIGWFVVSGALAAASLLAASGRLRYSQLRIAGAHLIWAVLGLLFVLYLLSVEALRLHHYCEWCSGVHVLVLITFILALVQWQRLMAARWA